MENSALGILPPVREKKPAKKKRRTLCRKEGERPGRKRHKGYPAMLFFFTLADDGGRGGKKKGFGQLARGRHRGGGKGGAPNRDLPTRKGGRDRGGEGKSYRHGLVEKIPGRGKEKGKKVVQ